MNNFSKFFARFVIRHRIVFILISLALTILFAYQLRHLTLQTNLGDFAPQKHPYLAVQRQLTHIFGGLNQISIAIEVKEGDIFNYSTLSKVHSITKKLYLLNGINAGRVVSLSARKIKSVKATAEGFGARRLMRYPPKSAEEMERLKETIVRNPMIYGPIVSKDFKSTLIQADFESDVSSRRIFRQVQQIIEEEKDSNNNIYIGGRPILEGWLDFYTPKMGKIFMGTLIVMILILYIAFRSKRGVLLPLASSLMATVWGLGILTLSGYKLGPTTILTPFLVLALGISHSVQFIKRYYEDELKHLSSKEASQETLQSLFVPACTSLVTDGLGFLSLLIVPLAMIRSMALATGAGVLSIFFTTVTFIPAILSFLPSPKRKEIEREEKFNLLNRILGKISSLSIHRFSRWAVVGIFLVLGVVGTIGASRIVVGDNEPGSASLYRNSPYNVAETMISNKFAGSSPYYVLIEGKEEEGLVDSQTLLEMESLTNYVKEKIPEAGHSLSLVDYIKGLNFAMFGGNPRYLRVPEKSQTIAEYLFLYSMTAFPGDFDPVVSPDYKYANIKFDLKDHKAGTINKVLTATKEWVDKNHKVQNFEFRYPGGDIGILAAINEIIRKVLPQNIIQLSSIVFICIWVAYGSYVAGILLLIPLVLGVLLTFGTLGLLGVSLTVETLPVAALGIGLGVDYGIYVTSRLRQELRQGLPFERAIYTSLETSGKAVFFTGATVALGVFSWVFSNIRLQARLGVILGALLLLNMLGALILLPALISIFKPKFIIPPHPPLSPKGKGSNKVQKGGSR